MAPIFGFSKNRDHNYVLRFSTKLYIYKVKTIAFATNL